MRTISQPGGVIRSVRPLLRLPVAGRELHLFAHADREGGGEPRRESDDIHAHRRRVVPGSEGEAW